MIRRSIVGGGSPVGAILLAHDYHGGRWAIERIDKGEYSNLYYLRRVSHEIPMKINLILPRARWWTPQPWWSMRGYR
jgi:hypothetical protein